MRYRKLLVAKVAVVATVLLLCLHFYISWKPQSEVTLRTFFSGMDRFAINIELLKDKYKTKKAEEKHSGDDQFLFNKEYLENVLDISDEAFNKIKESHQGYFEHIKTLKLDTFGTSVQKGSSGFVLIGGGKYSWLSYLVIRQIRATGSTLPIELFLPAKSDYEKAFCEKITEYNAKCNLLDQDFGRWVLLKFSVTGYQYKMLGILTSAFENVIYVDSDMFPVKKLDYLVDSQLYKEKGLLLWPDAWARTINPKFYQIAGVEVKENKVRQSKYDIKRAEREKKQLSELEFNFHNSNFHDFEGTIPNPTLEAGILVVNKSTHWKTLLLALYYNVYGPHIYYPLLTQGSAGEGDKETFIAAAHVMGEAYFQTKKQFQWVGYVSEAENKFVLKALGHFDPVTSEPDQDGLLIAMHCSYPKFYTDWFYNNNDLVYKDSGKHIRMYEAVHKNIGYDLDLRLFEVFVNGACKGGDEYMGDLLKYIGEDNVNDKRCSEVYLPHLTWLRENPIK